MVVFGPVPSRRLGRSLGINNIPFKNCTYNCIYCQLGKTKLRCTNRKTFYSPVLIYQKVKEKLDFLNAHHEMIDYLTFVADGEPTLDHCLEETIDCLVSFGLKIAVITNSSLLRDEEVQKALFKCDLVSLKLDAGSFEKWKKINRPPEVFAWDDFYYGVRDFVKKFSGECITETMLIKGVNDSPDDLEQIGLILQSIHPHICYISVPTRPPAEKWVSSPSEGQLLSAYQVLSGIKEIQSVKFLIDYEGNEFTPGQSIERDLLAIVSVHPMREEAINRYLERSHSNWGVVHKLVADKQIVYIDYQGERYYLRQHNRSLE